MIDYKEKLKSINKLNDASESLDYDSKQIRCSIEHLAHVRTCTGISYECPIDLVAKIVNNKAYYSKIEKDAFTKALGSVIFDVIRLAELSLEADYKLNRTRHKLYSEQLNNSMLDINEKI